MATPDFKFYRDWIVHNMGALAPFITDYELTAVFADITREMVIELGLEENLKQDTVNYQEANQYCDLPSDCIQVKRLSYEGSDGEEVFIDVIDWSDVRERVYYSQNDLSYAYCIGRRFYFSWDVTTDTTVTLYYMPFFTDGVVATDTDMGASNLYPPVYLSRAFRYGCLADLMTIHGNSQEQIIKADQWEKKYRYLMGRAQNNLKKTMPAHSNRRQVKNY